MRQRPTSLQRAGQGGGERRTVAVADAASFSTARERGTHMRRAIGILLLLLAVGGIGVIVGRSIAPPAPPMLRQEADSRAGLDVVVDQVDFRQTPLSEAFDALAKKTGTNIVVRWKVLEEAGADRDAPLTLRLNNLPLGRVLTLLCDEASIPQASVTLAWRVDGETVIVTTADERTHYTQVRLYDVRDLIESHYAYRVKTGWKPAPPERAASLLGAVSSTGVPGDPRVEAVETLTHLITESVAPDAWRDAGGTIGTIREMDGRFIITATPAMHEDVMRLLELLRTGK